MPISETNVEANYSIAVINQLNSECYVPIQNEGPKGVVRMSGVKFKFLAMLDVDFEMRVSSVELEYKLDNISIYE